MGSRARPTIAIVFTAVFVTNLDLFVVNVALPHIGSDFHGASLDSLSWVLNAYAIVFAALLVVAGRLADRNGHRGGFLFGLAVFTAGSALCARGDRHRVPGGCAGAAGRRCGAC